MKGIVKLIGIIMTVGGVIYFVKPDTMKKMVDFYMREKWIYFGAILAFIIGIVFLRAASQCAISWLVTLLGILALVKSILIFVLGKQKIKSFLDSLMKKPTKTLRTYALINIAVGVITIYSV